MRANAFPFAMIRVYSRFEFFFFYRALHCNLKSSSTAFIFWINTMNYSEILHHAWQTHLAPKSPHESRAIVRREREDAAPHDCQSSTQSQTHRRLDSYSARGVGEDCARVLRREGKNRGASRSRDAYARSFCFGVDQEQLFDERGGFLTSA